MVTPWHDYSPFRAMLGLLPHSVSVIPGASCSDSGFCGPTCRCKPSLPVGAKEPAQELENQIKERQGLFFDMEAYLPKKNG